jgi:preprotein translocase subunit SecE
VNEFGKGTVVSNDGKSDKLAFFSIYKRGQGKWLRWGTVAALASVALMGAWWLWSKEIHVAQLNNLGKILVVAIWMLVWALGTFRFVSSPKWGEFLIMTESEMRKVSWPSRREVINSTKVVILLTFGLGALLWLVDIGFIKLFQMIGIA